LPERRRSGISPDLTTDILDRYRRRADGFELKVAAVRPEQWSNPSPCEKWTARDVVDHVVGLHQFMLSPLDRSPRAAPPVADDPLAAFQAARADIEAVLADATLSAVVCDTPNGPMTVAQHIDEVASDDLPQHGWDLARATGQDDTIDPDDLERLWSITTAIPRALMDKYRTPGAFGPGIEVFGPEVEVGPDAPLQHRLLGLIGRDPNWTAP
jgi:uncharacterized protein (TIGR03086 family)